ncbi:hypothetical protein QJQ45_015135 [Haematococcus lacustris]|nr:hypothetical protein QJQ45_015135 [Haematococcus lacustris]
MSYPDPYMGAPMRDEPPGTEGQTQCKAFVGGLSYQINHEDLRKGWASGCAHVLGSMNTNVLLAVNWDWPAAFERYDAVSAEVMMDRHTGRPRGFGFVYFKDEQGLKDAVEQMHEKELEGRRISVTRAVPQDQTKPGTPAAILGGGSGARRDWGRRDYGRDERPPARGYDRGYGGGYERGGGYGGGGYDPRYAYDRGGYDRGYGGNGGYGGYDRRADPYADPYGRSGGAYGGYGGGYGGHYDDRAGYGAYDYGRPAAYEDRCGGTQQRRVLGVLTAEAMPLLAAVPTTGPPSAGCLSRPAAEAPPTSSLLLGYPPPRLLTSSHWHVTLRVTLRCWCIPRGRHAKLAAGETSCSAESWDRTEVQMANSNVRSRAVDSLSKAAQQWDSVGVSVSLVWLRC